MLIVLDRAQIEDTDACDPAWQHKKLVEEISQRFDIVLDGHFIFLSRAHSIETVDQVLTAANL
ncbi:uncharacterized protein RCO7_14874 [Rhynchosporium graminicola]|uniref:Uncharacterized protein n=1 Tax=Rhynchosporium graminicola TaxID=2792576 RepID=A0A1E1L6Y1_9HELO|nr:uncharacterized protein RCO7_14874 [Rhynchosporium commune]